MKIYGLLGHPLSRSLSKMLFAEEFQDNNLDYQLFDHADLIPFLDLVKKEPELQGFNVTVPHKISIITYLDELDPIADESGTVNVVSVLRGNKGQYRLKGYNTDIPGFESSLYDLPISATRKAFILGTGGSARTVQFVLTKKAIDCIMVSRSGAADNAISYDQLNEMFGENDMLINCSPAGMYTDELPGNIKPEIIRGSNIVYDLVYNPEETPLLKIARDSGAIAKNGMEMFRNQARESWKIWGLIS
jgi:shikimate dehydrogenase